jgi:hypothetical protein
MQILAHHNWFTFAESPDGKEKAEFAIRTVPPPVEQQLRLEIYGRTRKVRNVKGGSITTEDAEKDREFGRRLIAYALSDSRNVDIPVPPGINEDAELREAYNKAFPPKGEDGPAQPDQVLRMDGHWTPELKLALLPYLPGVFQFISESAGKLSKGVRAQEEEEGKD